MFALDMKNSDWKTVLIFTVVYILIFVTTDTTCSSLPSVSKISQTLTKKHNDYRITDENNGILTIIKRNIQKSNIHNNQLTLSRHRYNMEMSDARKGTYGYFCFFYYDCDKLRNGRCGDNFICSCKRNFVKYNETVCLSKVSIGNYCEETVQCDENAICDQFKECNCISGYESNYNGECSAKKVKLGKRCQYLAECEPTSSVCDPSTKKCVCMSGYSEQIRNVCSKIIYKSPINYLTIIIAVVVVAATLALLFILVTTLRRKFCENRSPARQQTNHVTRTSIDHISLSVPFTISSEQNSFISSIEETDKPPTYEEAVQSSKSMTNLVYNSVEPPPSYLYVQQPSTSRRLSL